MNTKHIRSLDALNISGDIQMEWAREGKGHESKLDWLLEFPKKEIQCRERSQTFKDSRVKIAIASERRAKVNTAAALVKFVSRLSVDERQLIPVDFILFLYQKIIKPNKVVLDVINATAIFIS